MKKYNAYGIFFFLLSLLIILVASYTILFKTPSQTLWEYQCVDTMKVSRDRARFLKGAPAIKEIAYEMKTIKNLGANCVAIDTPYDEEFVPYLTMWVEQARVNNLHIWFRGNFSRWEGWFSYPKGMTTDEHLFKTKQFILAHADLFADGDIFTPAPEAENGWSNGYVVPTDYPRFRQFLIAEQQNAQNTFTIIGKKIKTNWLSMNGGLAKSMLDEPTIRALDNTVTIDHYVHGPEEMKQYIDYFHQKFNAHVVIGEFGAPIPDINGTLSENQQADFVESIFQTLYQEHDVVSGVNYWTLSEGTTALLDKNGEPKPVTTVIKHFYQPIDSIRKFLL